MTSQELAADSRYDGKAQNLNAKDFSNVTGKKLCEMTRAVGFRKKRYSLTFDASRLNPVS